MLSSCGTAKHITSEIIKEVPVVETKIEYRDRVIQLGENPESVFEVGAVGIDNIVRLKLLSLQDLEKQIKNLFS